MLESRNAPVAENFLFLSFSKFVCKLCARCKMDLDCLMIETIAVIVDSYSSFVFFFCMVFVNNVKFSHFCHWPKKVLESMLLKRPRLWFYFLQINLFVLWVHNRWSFLVACVLIQNGHLNALRMCLPFRCKWLSWVF